MLSTVGRQGCSRAGERCGRGRVGDPAAAQRLERGPTGKDGASALGMQQCRTGSEAGERALTRAVPPHHLRPAQARQHLGTGPPPQVAAVDAHSKVDGTLQPGGPRAWSNVFGRLRCRDVVWCGAVLMQVVTTPEAGPLWTRTLACRTRPPHQQQQPAHDVGQHDGQRSWYAAARHKHLI